MATHDRAFLDKIEQFLLHPSVRALSLAQRVDFLEQKGLSADEITRCLQSVQAHNGLSRLVEAPAKAAISSASSAVATASASTSKLALLARVTRQYGAVALVLSLLGVGYLRFRQRATEQLVVEYQAERTKRRVKRNTQVGALLNVVHDQQTQYNQAAALLQRRVEKVAKMQQDVLANRSAATSSAVEMRKRHEEVHNLKTTLLQLKREVMKAFAPPPASPPATPARAIEAVESTKTAVTTVDTAVQVNAVPEVKQVATVAVGTPPALPLALKTTAIQPVKPKEKKKSAALISRPVDVAELMGGQADNDELSTSLSYRLLSATW